MASFQHLELLASAARTAAVNTPDQSNLGCKGVRIVIDITVDPAAAAVTYTLQGKDPISGKYYTILASAALAAVATTTLTVYPGITATANVSASNVLPAVWRVAVTVADTDSMTYSVNAELLP